MTQPNPAPTNNASTPASQPRLVFITGDFAPMTGGIASFMADIVGLLPADQVRIIAAPHADSDGFDAQQAYCIERLKVRGSTNHTPKQMKFLAIQYFQRLLAGPRPDYVVCCHGRLWLMLAAAIYRFIAGVPYAVFLHGTDVLDARKRRSARLYDQLLRRARLVIPNSRLTAEAAASAGLPTDRIVVINPCVNQALLAPSQPRSTFRHSLGLTDQPLILSVARLVPNKGIDVVLRALPAVLESCPEAHYVIVGEGPSRHTLEELTRALNLEAHVSFVGYQPRASMANIYQDADVFVLTPRTIASGASEGFGLVYLEANMLELPVVAADVGGIQDAVLNGETGLLVSSESSEATAKALLTLLQDPDQRAILGYQGRKRATDHFGCSVAAEQLMAALIKTLANDA